MDIVRLVKELKGGDRMEAHASIGECVKAVATSVVGWSQWLSNPSIMNLFTETELVDVLKRMKSATVAFLELDASATRLLDSKTNGKIDSAEVDRRVV